ncbi:MULTISPECIES: GPW/gp25 family protein [Gammaproteobacteria]|uniref:GPW/gp25 family protein n=1 Tax=Gammaproteobacteria TaxID=1236 RepID=UPI0006D4836B|nr:MULTISPECIES: GPW/gp25 family protein [Gammaproteobacteria]MBG7114734.1 GPW/gp25 family protein [Pseudomonas aeruginosa]HDT5887814.1 GPW/gp25 family protein [Aeromonas dhakensis]HEB4980734.1 GPW/gp25 family protein [Aeromonas dhakensis]
MTQEYTNITAAHWQPALKRDGEIVSGIGDIDQAIRIILSTPKGSDPHRPDFGSRIPDWLDRPVDRVRPHLVREAVDALRVWEPRIVVESVRIDVDAECIKTRVLWRAADGVTRLTEVQHDRPATA